MHPSGPSTLRQTLSGDHRRLDALFTELTDASEAGVGGDVLGELWTRFTQGLLAHLAAEEAVLFPLLAPRHPAEIRELRADHDRLRDALAGLDVEVDLHLIRHPTVVSLIGQLRDHAAREERTLYPWADEAFGAEAHRPVLDRIRSRLHAGSTAP